MKRSYLRGSWLVVVVVCLSIAYVLWANLARPDKDASEKERVLLGPYELAIPRDNVLQEQVPLYFRMIPGLRKAHETLVYFPLDNIRAAVPAISLNEGLRAILEALPDPKHAQAAEQQRALDMWYGRGDFESRVIEPIDGTQFSRVYQWRRGSSSWFLVRNHKDGDPEWRDFSDYYIGVCSSYSYGVHCSVRTYFDDFVLKFKVNEEVMPDVQRLQVWLASEVRRWKSR